MANFDQLSAAQIAAGVANGDFTATEVARAALDAVEARDVFSGKGHGSSNLHCAPFYDRVRRQEGPRLSFATLRKRKVVVRGFDGFAPPRLRGWFQQTRGAIMKRIIFIALVVVDPSVLPPRNW